MIEIQNRGKNLAQPKILNTSYCFFLNDNTYIDYGNMGYSLQIASIPKTSKQLYVKFHHETQNSNTEARCMINIWINGSANINIGSISGWNFTEGRGYYKTPYTSGYENDTIITLPKLDYPYTIVLSNRTGAGNKWSKFSNILVTENINDEYSPSLNEKLQLNI